MSATNEWVTVYETHDEIEARLKEGLLRQSGMECILEASIYRPRSVAPLYNRYKLNVKRAVVDDARAILAEIE